MIGGAGDDTYYIDNAHDAIIELAGGGTDIVYSAITLALPANVEKLTLTGTAAINGFGNADANVLVGNGAANVLDGGAGADTLQGGGGADTFRLLAAPTSSTDYDTIADFTPGTDHIQLGRTAFNLGSGSTLNASYFYQGPAAHDGNDHIIYDPSSGNLFYDSDGTGAAAQVVIAHLQTGLTLTAADFTLG